MAPLNHERLTALRQALAHTQTATAALIDLSDALKEADIQGLAWDAGYLADRVDALAGAVTLLAQVEEDRSGQSDEDEAGHSGLRTG